MDDRGFTAFSDTVQTVYEAALAPEKWPRALARIGRLFDAEGAVVIFYNGRTPADFITCEELRPAVDIYQREGWWRSDLHAIRAIDLHLTHGDVFNDQTVATPEEIETHPIYVDFFRKVGFGWLMSNVMLPDLDMLVALSVPRAREKGPFGHAEMEILKSIGRHVEQSLRMASLEAGQTALRAAVDAMEAGVYVLDACGRLIFSNVFGGKRLSDFFIDEHSALVPRLHNERERFGAMIAAAHHRPDSVPPLSCVLTGADESRVAVWAIPAGAATRGFVSPGSLPKTLLFATPIARDTRIDPSVIRDLFDLSLGEARLAALVGGGLATREAAERLGVTEGTARVVLQRVFRKLGINRQAQLVSQLANLAPFGALSIGPTGLPRR